MIRYALTGGEIACLSDLMGLRPAPALAIEPGSPEMAFAGLVEKKIIRGAPDHPSVDMVAALLTKTLCFSDRIWELRAGRFRALVMRRGELTLAVSRDRHLPGGYLLEPTRDRESLAGALERALELNSRGAAFAALPVSYPSDECQPASDKTYGPDEFAALLYQTKGDPDGPVSA